MRKIVSVLHLLPIYLIFKKHILLNFVTISRTTENICHLNFMYLTVVYCLCHSSKITTHSLTSPVEAYLSGLLLR